ncbi:terminase small subunit [Pseudomonas aeruginosa]|nr:terminase small subunit [Pseudomonas aeruginosa]MDI3811475.1 terminase small subunit [Pseudomonas aeruginosa]
MALILNKREFAEARDVSERTVTRWIAEGLPNTGSGKKGDPIRINLSQAIAWEVEREVARQTGDGHIGAEGLSKEQEALRKLSAERKRSEVEAELAALALGEKRKELISVELVEQTLAEAFTQVARILRPVGRKVIPKVLTARNEADGLQIFDDELVRAMTVAADMLEEIEIYAAPPEEDAGPSG